MKCRAAFPALLVLAQRLCHEKDGDKQEKQAISVDIAARNTFKKVQSGSWVMWIIRKRLERVMK